MLLNEWYIQAYNQTKGNSIRFIVTYSPKCSYDLAGLYILKPFQSPMGYSSAAVTSSKHCRINARYPFLQLGRLK